MADESIVEEIQHQENIHEVEDDKKYTRDGSLDRRGRRAIKGKSGGWRVAILILVNQALATLALYGVGVNLVVFMTRVLKHDNADAANDVSNWTATGYIFSLVGAIISDSYWGRYNSCTIFQLIFVAGLVELSLLTCFLLFKPCVPGLDHPQCKSPGNLEIQLFYLSIYQIALGNGGYQPSITTFGADQFDEDDPKEQLSKVAFFSYFFVANNVGTLFSNTLLAYLEDKGDWGLGFWLSSGAALLGLVLFLIGTPRFRHFKAHGNPLSRFCQVIVAAIKKRNISTPHDAEHLYEVEGKNAANGGRKILHTPDFKFLDRAASMTLEDCSTQDNQHPPNPWNLCTITQVEEVKCILRLLPIWLCTIMYAVAYNQMGSVYVEQGTAMNTTILNFSIPPASMSIFEILSVSGFVVLYRLQIVPLISRLRKDPRGLTELQRMGIGLVLVAFTMVSAGIVEYQRKVYAKHDYDDGNTTSSLSILWQIPQYTGMGISEVFMLVSQLEFFNCQAPDGLKSFGSALFLASMALGGYFSSFIVTVVMRITSRGHQVGWISDDLNKGHMDKFFFLLAALVSLDLAMFVVCAKWYRCIRLEGRSDSEIIQVNEGVRVIEL